MIERVLTHDADWSAIESSALQVPFSSDLLDLASRLSVTLTSAAEARRSPELMALGFWLRKSNLTQITRPFQNFSEEFLYAPRGTVVHFTPANVDTMFVYSWVISLLCGNRNIVRLSSRSSPAIEFLLRMIDETFAAETTTCIASANSFVRSDHSLDSNQRLSAVADTRVIWGGDQTIASIRQARIPATSNEIAFADKVSLTVIDGNYWCDLGSDKKKSLAEKFAADAYLFGQAACSSPSAVVWVGQDLDASPIELFWNLVGSSTAVQGYDFQQIDFVNKLLTQQLAATRWPILIGKTHDNRLSRSSIDFSDLPAILASELRPGAGHFYETQIPSLACLANCTSRKLQTISYAGIAKSEWRDLLSSPSNLGIDRVVPIGKSLDFNSTWDGLQLFEAFLRRITLTQ